MDATKERGEPLYRFYDPVSKRIKTVKISLKKSNVVTDLVRGTFFEFIRLKSVAQQSSLPRKIVETFIPPKGKLILFEEAMSFICESIEQYYGVSVEQVDDSNEQLTLKVSGRSTDVLQVNKRSKQLSTSQFAYKTFNKGELAVYIRHCVDVLFSRFPCCSDLKVQFMNSFITFEQNLRKGAHAEVGSPEEFKLRLSETIKDSLASLSRDHQYCFHGDVHLVLLCGKVFFEKENRIPNRMKIGELKRALNLLIEEDLRDKKEVGARENETGNNKSRIRRHFNLIPFSEKHVVTVVDHLEGYQFTLDQDKSYEMLLHSGHVIKLDSNENMTGIICPPVVWLIKDIIHKDDTGCDVRLDITSTRESSPGSIYHDKELQWLSSSDGQPNILHDLGENGIFLTETVLKKAKSVVKKTKKIYSHPDNGPSGIEVVVVESQIYQCYNNEILSNPEVKITWHVQMKLNDDYEDYEFDQCTVDVVTDTIISIQSSIL